MSQLTAPYDVPKSTIKNIFNNEILNSPEIGFDKATSLAQPRGVMLAGQPGAGKSAVKESHVGWVEVRNPT